MIKYYIHDGIDQEGPFTIEELRGQRLNQNIQVWHNGLRHWSPVQDLPELEGFVSDEAVPPPYVMYNLPVEDSEDSYIKKRPVNLILTIVLTIIAIVILATLANHFYENFYK